MWLIATSISTSVVALAGASVYAPITLAKSQNPISLTVAYMPNMGGASTLAVAQNMGFFKKSGLNVKLQQFQTGPSEFDAMASGTINIAYIGSGASYLPMEGKAKIFMIDSIGFGDGVLASASSGVKTVAQLKGKSVLLPLGTTAEIILYEALKKAGLTLNDVTLVNTTPTAEIPAFISGKAPIIAGWDPGLTDALAQSKGSKLLAYDKQFYPQLSLPGIWCASNQLAKHPVTVEKFTWAMMQAMNYKKTHMKQTVNWVSQMTSIAPNLLTASVKDSTFLTGQQLETDYKKGLIKKWFNTLSQTFVAMKALPKAPSFNTYFIQNVIPNSSKLPK